MGVYHADLDNSARCQLMCRFDTADTHPMTLICSYYVNSVGTNMQEQCRNVHCLCLPMGFPMLHQAIGRVRRLGQKSLVKVYEYHLVKSFNTKQLSNNVSKVLPALAMQINNSNWNMHLRKNADNDQIEITMKDTWVQNGDYSISRLRAPLHQYIPPSELLDANGLDECEL